MSGRTTETKVLYGLVIIFGFVIGYGIIERIVTLDECLTLLD